MRKRDTSYSKYIFLPALSDKVRPSIISNQCSNFRRLVEVRPATRWRYSYLCKWSSNKSLSRRFFFLFPVKRSATEHTFEERKRCCGNIYSGQLSFSKYIFKIYSVHSAPSFFLSNSMAFACSNVSSNIIYINLFLFLTRPFLDVVRIWCDFDKRLVSFLCCVGESPSSTSWHVTHDYDYLMSVFTERPNTEWNKWCDATRLEQKGVIHEWRVYTCPVLVFACYVSMINRTVRGHN